MGNCDSKCHSCALNLSDGLYLHAGGPYTTRKGNDVTIQCTFIPQMPNNMEGAVIGLDKLTEDTLSFMKMFQFLVINNTAESVYQSSPARLQIANESFSVTFTAWHSHDGEYRCLYNKLPYSLRSNTTSVTVKG